MEEKTYLDAIGRVIPDEALEQFLNAPDGQFEETGEHELTFVPDGYYVLPGRLPEPKGC